MHERVFITNLPRGLDEIDAVIVMFVDARRDRKNIRIEDDVLGRKAGVFRQNLIGARANSTLRSSVSAWPFSSKAITTTAAP